MPGTITVEVVAALPDRTLVRTVELPAGASLAQAVERSGLLAQCPELHPVAALGVFGRVRNPAEPARPGDRVEIYRALHADPKEARRRRAAGRERR